MLAPAPNTGPQVVPKRCGGQCAIFVGRPGGRIVKPLCRRAYPFGVRIDATRVPATAEVRERAWPRVQSLRPAKTPGLQEPLCKQQDDSRLVPDRPSRTRLG